MLLPGPEHLHAATNQHPGGRMAETTVSLPKKPRRVTRVTKVTHPTVFTDDAENSFQRQLEANVGGPEVAQRIRYILAGSPKDGRPQFSTPHRVGYLLRMFPQLHPKNPRAQLLYRHLADLAKIDKDGKPTWATVTHQKLAGWLGCSVKSVSRYVRELELTNVLPLIASRPGVEGRASQFLLLLDPFAWAWHQSKSDGATLDYRQGAKTIDIAAAWLANERGELTPEQVAQVETRAKRKQTWRTAPSRMTRFKSR